MRRKRNNGFALFILYAVIGIYFLNSGLNLIKFPEAFLKIDRVISIIAGILLVLGGINFVRLRRYLP